MYGQAVGDALGLLTEFRSKDEAQSILTFGGSKLRLDFDRGRDSGCPNLNIGHLNGFKLNGWTDDTDQAMCMYRALEQKAGGDPRSEEQLFAQEIVNWRSSGMPGRAAPPSGLGNLVGHVMGDLAVLNDSGLAGRLQKKFLENPHEAAENIWSRLAGKQGYKGLL